MARQNGREMAREVSTLRIKRQHDMPHWGMPQNWIYSHCTGNDLMLLVPRRAWKCHQMFCLVYSDQIKQPLVCCCWFVCSHPVLSAVFLRVTYEEFYQYGMNVEGAWLAMSPFSDRHLHAWAMPERPAAAPMKLFHPDNAWWIRVTRCRLMYRRFH